MTHPFFNPKDVTRVALGTSFLIVSSWLSIPWLIPITMQTFAVCLVSAVFGLRLGFWIVISYSLLGSFGLPVFAGFQNGIAVLTGVTGGYIIGFLFAALVVGFAADRFGREFGILLVSMVLGVLLCYCFGTAWFILVYAKNSGRIGILTALNLCVFPYLIPDSIKIFLAASIASRIPVGSLS